MPLTEERKGAANLKVVGPTFQTGYLLSKMHAPPFRVFNRFNWADRSASKLHGRSGKKPGERKSAGIF
jgi:hypothetical protein